MLQCARFVGFQHPGVNADAIGVVPRLQIRAQKRIEIELDLNTALVDLAQQIGFDGSLDFLQQRAQRQLVEAGHDLFDA